MPRELRLDRDLRGTGPKNREGAGRWAKWRVIDVDAGETVGQVVEDREFDGSFYRPSTYSAAHNPALADFGALWRTDGHPTPAAALEALADHLARLSR